MKEEREKLANHIGEIQKTLREFLRPYYPEALPEDLRAGVQTLSKELSEWQTLQRRKEQLEEQNAGNLALSQALTGSIRAALSRYQALDETRTLRECTQALCRRFAQYTLSSARAERYFADSHRHKKRRRRRNWMPFLRRSPRCRAMQARNWRRWSVTRAHGRWQADSFFRRSRR